MLTVLLRRLQPVRTLMIFQRRQPSGGRDLLQPPSALNPQGRRQEFCGILNAGLTVRQLKQLQTCGNIFIHHANLVDGGILQNLH